MRNHAKLATQVAVAAARDVENAEIEVRRDRQMALKSATRQLQETPD